MSHEKELKIRPMLKKLPKNEGKYPIPLFFLSFTYDIKKKNFTKNFKEGNNTELYKSLVHE